MPLLTISTKNTNKSNITKKNGQNFQYALNKLKIKNLSSKNKPYLLQSATDQCKSFTSLFTLNIKSKTRVDELKTIGATIWWF